MPDGRKAGKVGKGFASSRRPVAEPDERSPAADPAAELEQLIHQPVRLRIMAALVALPTGESTDFTTQKELLGLTDGNLSSHLSTLEAAGYVSVEKEFVGKRPRTSMWITREGRTAFERYISALESIIKGSAG